MFKIVCPSVRPSVSPADGISVQTPEQCLSGKTGPVEDSETLYWTLLDIKVSFLCLNTCFVKRMRKVIVIINVLMFRLLGLTVWAVVTLTCLVCVRACVCGSGTQRMSGIQSNPLAVCLRLACVGTPELHTHAHTLITSHYNWSSK